MTPPARAFAHHYVRPDLDAAGRENDAFAREVRGAHTRDALLDALARWNTARTALDTQRQIASVRYHQDTRDSSTRAEEDFWNDASPLLREWDALFANTLLAHPLRDAIDAAHGPQLLALKRCDAMAFAPAIRDAIQREAHAVSEYTALLAEPAVHFRGETLNLSQLARHFVDPDRTTRLEAQSARDAFMHERADALDGIFDRLVHLRDEMGRALGHANFIPLGYALMHRTMYGPDEVARFRDEIRATAVPVARALAARQARRLGLEKLLFHDEAVTDPKGNPRPLGGPSVCLDAAREMFHAFSSELHEFIDVMCANDLFDLESREGKAGGGFCTMFWDLGLPFVFANFNGTDSDVTTLVHECGHAFAAYRTRAASMLEYRFPTFEACEVHSMSMEYLAWPWMDRFFGADEADRVRSLHLESRLVALPYMAAIDAFQHEVYARPELSPRMRRSAWRDIERTFIPDREYPAELSYLSTGALWQRQMHLFATPFYYIDYAMAQTCALQLRERAAHSRAVAVRDYLALCNAGGTVPFVEMLARGNVRSPLESGTLGDVIAATRRDVGL